MLDWEGLHLADDADLARELRRCETMEWSQPKFRRGQAVFLRGSAGTWVKGEVRDLAHSLAGSPRRYWVSIESENMGRLVPEHELQSAELPDLGSLEV